jgi:hypothetical protein
MLPTWERKKMQTLTGRTIFFPSGISSHQRIITPSDC